MFVRIANYDYQHLSFHDKILNIICYFHSFCSDYLDNVMHYFNHGLANIVTPIFLQKKIHLKEMQQAFHAFKFKHGFSFFEIGRK
jgi:hypothetical protein